MVSAMRSTSSCSIILEDELAFLPSIAALNIFISIGEMRHGYPVSRDLAEMS
jgi:hypothetical protein